MKLNILRRSTALLIGLSLIYTMTILTFAIKRDAVISIPVKVSAVGTLPESSETYTVRITAGDSNTPMPNDQVGGSFVLELNDAQEAVILTIKFSSVGEYNYKIEQIAGANSKCKYDTRKYSMNVIVSNSKDGEYDAAVIIHEEGKEAKPVNIEFTNEYKSSGSNITPPKTGDDSRIFMWCVLLVTSGFGMIGSAFLGKKDAVKTKK